MNFQTISWDEALGCPKIIDQTALPGALIYKHIKNVEEMFTSIQELEVRGAPAIGIAAAYGMILAIESEASLSAQKDQLNHAGERLSASRPTAVNLFWSINRMLEKCNAYAGNADDFKDFMLAEARIIHAEDADLCEKMSIHGADLIEDGMTILTHCNAGALATGGRGTAIGVITKAFEQGKKISVLVDETRPLLQGSRLTAWELAQAGIPFKIITDNMSGHFMKSGNVDFVITGADRIATNGDAANKIGTYNLAVLAKHHKIPFYIAAPVSTFDAKINSGAEIKIEQRNPKEILQIKGVQIAPENSKVLNPAFDITPDELIHGIVTEAGVLRPPFEAGIRKFLKNAE